MPHPKTQHTTSHNDKTQLWGIFTWCFMTVMVIALICFLIFWSMAYDLPLLIADHVMTLRFVWYIILILAILAMCWLLYSICCQIKYLIVGRAPEPSAYEPGRI